MLRDLLSWMGSSVYSKMLLACVHSHAVCILTALSWLVCSLAHGDLVSRKSSLLWP